MALRGDYAAGYRAVRRILALGEARGYEPEHLAGALPVRCPDAAGSSRSKTVSRQAQRAREGLIAGGDLANAGYTYYADRVLPAGLRAIAGRLRRRGGGGAGLRAAYRQRADRPVARQLPVAGGCAARRKLRRSRRGGPRRQVRRQPAGAFPRACQPARSPPPSSAIRPVWRGTPRRRCRCCRLPWATTRPPWPACCAGWPWPGRPAPPTVTSAAACCPNWTR